MRVRRILSWSGLLLLIALGLLWPALFFDFHRSAAVDDPVRFSDYRADFTVDSGGRLSAVETITASFPAGRHGIVRAFSDDNALAPHTRQVPTDLVVEVDGAPAHVDSSWSDATTYLVRIGDPDRFLDPGVHVVTIRYGVAGVLDPASTGAGLAFRSNWGDARAGASVFFWQVVPSWNTEIGHAEVAVTLPGPVLGAGCSVGAGARERPCVGFDIAGNTVRIRASDLDPHTPITVRAGTDVPAPTRAYLPWTPRFDGILGRSVGGLLWPAALTLLAVIGSRLWLRCIRDRSIPAPVQHQPPDGLGPAQWDYLRTLKVGPDALTATLLHLAENDLITLTEVNEKRWTMTGIGDQEAWKRIDGVSRRAAAALRVTRPGDVLNANGTNAAGRRLAAAREEIHTALESWTARDRLVVSDRRREAVGLRCCGAVAAVLAVAVFLPWTGVATVWGVPFTLVFLMSLPAWRASAGVRRSPAGRDATSKALGFHRFLATKSSESRFDFAGRTGLYTAYLPYAVAAGIAARWAETFEKVTGTPAPQPQWSGVGSSTSDGAVALVGLQSVISTSIEMYLPPSASGSDGGYGGGSAGGWDGGGGGGGGGGSW